MNVFLQSSGCSRVWAPFMENHLAETVSTALILKIKAWVGPPGVNDIFP